MSRSELIPPEVDDSVVAQVIVPAPLISKSIPVAPIVGSGNIEVVPTPIGGGEDES